MSNIHEMPNWTAVDLIAENMAAAEYFEKLKAFENTKIEKTTNKRVPHEGMPNYKKIYNSCKDKAYKAAKKTEKVEQTASAE